MLSQYPPLLSRAQSDNEYIRVHEYFRNLPLNTQVSSSVFFSKAMSNGLQDNNGYVYIKMSQGIYVFTPSTKPIGEGSYGKVQWLRSLSQDRYYVIKTMKWHRQGRDGIAQEIKILQDLGLCVEFGELANEPSSLASAQETQRYIVMPYVGMSLVSYLSTNRTDFSLAIQVCWEVHCLHQGFKSKSGTPYAHRDLKPENMTKDTMGHVHLIDMGAALSKLDQPPEDGKCTPMYFPNMKSLTDTAARPRSLRQLDVFALKRTLYMPDELLCAKGPKTAHNRPMILSKSVLDAAGLLKYIDTSMTEIEDAQRLSSQCFQYEPCILAALLVLGKYNLAAAHAEQLVNSPELAYKVLGVYFYHQESFCIDNDLIKMNIYKSINVQSVPGEFPVDSILGAYIKAGITRSLIDAVERQTSFILLSLLNSSTPLIKRVVVLLWQNNIRDREILLSLRNNEPLATDLIELVFNEQMSRLDKMLAVRQRCRERSREAHERYGLFSAPAVGQEDGRLLLPPLPGLDKGAKKITRLSS